jgi:hypothetical protein
LKNANKSYPLEWLDLLITVTLKPSKTDIGAITDVQLNNIILRISEENPRLQLLIKSQVFSTNKENEIKRIPPEKAIALLKEDGIEVTAEQVKVILDFMYEIADIVVDQYLAKLQIYTYG